MQSCIEIIFCNPILGLCVPCIPTIEKKIIPIFYLTLTSFIIKSIIIIIMLKQFLPVSITNVYNAGYNVLATLYERKKCVHYRFKKSVSM